MHIEVREKKDRKYYYLAHSARIAGKVKKFRRYLGKNLTEKEITEKTKKWEKIILKQVEEYRKISDPLHTILSEKDREIIDNLIGKADLKIKHLTEKNWQQFTENFAYDTNAIEGSTITQTEAKEILKEDRWPPTKTRQEIAETYGVAEAIKEIRETRQHLTLDLIKELHKIVFKNSKTYAGRFREKGVEVVVADAQGNIIHRGAPQEKIRNLLKELINWYDKNKKNYHPIVLAAVVHNQFENIHPFQDGNGRVGRLLLNNILLKHDLPPVNIELVNR
ncbi:Fic family protein, partial [Candidatus Woesearchaeota archaeon]|nr:Fic family protein [Candidatus Woesearchaeota archaeon]